MKRSCTIILAIIAIFSVFVLVFSRRDIPQNITYGVSFSKLHSDELGLDWKETYLSVLDDLKARRIRLSAHWPMIESKNGEYRFEEMDYQMNEANKRGADVILAVGHRLPGWPECHDPDWALNLDKEDKQKEILEYIEKTVDRYKNSPNLRYFQIENEVFLPFAKQYCGKADEDFLAEEIELVRKLDPNRKIVITDSGEFGKWYKARRYGDIFGTSVYLYIWHDVLGPMRYPITPGFFRLKQNIMDFISGPRQTILIELGAEPWLMQPIVKAPVSLQMERMGLDKFKEVIEFNKSTGFGEQYLWGTEWWYWLKKNGNAEFWDEAKKLFNKP